MKRFILSNIYLKYFPTKWFYKADIYVLCPVYRILQRVFDNSETFTLNKGMPFKYKAYFRKHAGGRCLFSVSRLLKILVYLCSFDMYRIRIQRISKYVWIHIILHTHIRTNSEILCMYLLISWIYRYQYSPNE